MAVTRTPRKSSGVTRTPHTSSGTTNSNRFNFGYNLGNAANFYGATPVKSGGGGSSGGGSSSGGSSGGGSSYSSGGGSSYSARPASASSSRWGCPGGASLVQEPGGTGNLVCRWNANGGLFAAQPIGAGGGSTPAPTAPVNDTPIATQTPSEWLQGAADTFARNPSALLAIRMKDQYGESGGNALQGMLEPYVDAMNAMFLSQRGTTLESGSKEEQLQYMDDYLTQLQTPGARIDTRGALTNIFEAPDGSPLQQYLTQGDATEQANNTLNLIAGATQTGYNPLFAKGIMDRLRLERDRYVGESGRTAVGSFVDYLNTNVPGLKQMLG